MHDTLDLKNDQFRLLRIRSRVAGSIQCSLEIFDRDLSPSYAAVSYVWGDETDLQSILVNSHEFLITRNLYSFLEQVGSVELMSEIPMVHENHMYLWIDQITIDQNNPLERNHQVQNMADIFSQAAVVISWLGSADTNGESDQAMKHIKTTVTELLPYQEHIHQVITGNYGGDRVLDTVAQQKEDFFHAHKHAFQLISRLFARPYWRRLWIVQEFVLAQRLLLLCGDRVITWPTMKFFNKFCEACARSPYGFALVPNLPDHLSTKIWWQDWGLPADHLPFKI